MAKVQRWCLLICLAVLPIISTAQSTAAPVYPLSQVIITGAVSVRFRSTGASSGDSMLLTISKGQSAGNSPLLVDVPAGTRLTNVSGTGQSMVLGGVRGIMQGPNVFSPISRIELTDNNPHTYLLTAYCAEFDKDNPSPDSIFEVGVVDPTLACIVRDSMSEGLSIQSAQAAVWIYTDRVSSDAVVHKFPMGPGDWSVAVSVEQRCASATPEQSRQTFSPHQMSMQGTMPPQQQVTSPTASRREQGFLSEQGTLYISPGFVRFAWTITEKGAAKGSWSASCNQLTKWKADPHEWTHPDFGEVQIWVGRQEHRIRTWQGGKQEQDEILRALANACGRPWVTN